MDNSYGCKGCAFLTKQNKCKFDGELQDCLSAGDCCQYEESELETRLMEIIKEKVDKASPEELQESLEIIEAKLKEFAILGKGVVE